MAIYQDGDGFGDFGFSIKRAFKKAKKFVSKPIKQTKVGKIIGRVAQASLLPLTASTQVTTWALSKTKIKPFVKLQSKVVKAREFVRTHPLQVFAAEAAAVAGGYAIAPYVTGAGAATTVGAPIVTTAAPTVAAGGIGVGTVGTGAAATTGLVTTATELVKKEAIELAKKEAASLMEKGTEAAQALLAAGAQPSEVAAMTPAEQDAAAAVLKTPRSNTAPIIGAVIGFVVGGPIGAAAGGAAGYALTKE